MDRIIHRAKVGDLPENSLVALVAAAEADADAVEIDVRSTSDGVPVLFHDWRPKKIGEGFGIIGWKNYNDLKNLPLRLSGHPDGVIIASLEEGLEILAGKKLVILDLKAFVNTDIVVETLELIERMGMTDEVMVSSFYPNILRQTKALNPYIRTAFIFESLIGQMYHQWWRRNRTDCDELHVRFGLLDHDFISDSHKRGYKVATWTLNDEDNIIEAMKWGVDGIITDRISLLNSLMAQD